MLKLNNVKKSFQNGSQTIDVLRGVNLELSLGQSLAITGPSGSGKSTLLSLLTGLEVPDSGIVEVAGCRLDQASVDERAKIRLANIGIVFQNFFLIPHLTAIENVLMPALLRNSNMDEMQTRAQELLGSVGLSGRADHRPQQLSGGEQQRVAIARALLLNPKLVVADEPTGNLDAQTADQITDVLFESVSLTGASMVLVTHDMQRAKRCQQCLQIERGVLKVQHDISLV